MTIILANKKQLSIRLLTEEDRYLLLQYLQSLSAESRSRFGPHAFDETTVTDICNQLPGDTSRYIAIDEASGIVVAYMLIKKGMIVGDRQRYAARQQYFDEDLTVTYAPSVADGWQSSGLGSSMYAFIEEELKRKGVTTIVLWAGVQASNEKAAGFYTKWGYLHMANFWHDGKNNYDMIKTIA